VTIFLDAARFLEEAIASVLAQTFEDWELILVDDGSRDGSTQIARGYADRWPCRIRYFDHPDHANLGMSASRNAGIAASRGELLAFLDADDVFRPEKLERQIAILDRVPEAAMVYGRSEHWFSWTGRDEDRARDCPRRLGVEPETLVHPPTLIPRFLTLESQTPGTCGILLRRTAVDAVGGFEDQFRGMFEDQAFLFKICAALPVFVESGSWDRYRMHPASVTARTRASGEEWTRGVSPTHRAFLEWLEAYLARLGVDDRRVQGALAAAMFRYRHPIRHALRPSTFGARAKRGAVAARGRLVSRVAGTRTKEAARLGR
jgi:glycosyltransferase involved in cell wall biosynthesis